VANLGIDVRIILKQNLKMECGCEDRIHLAQDRVQWRTLVNMETNLPVP
jgi:hypothetical protein